jgi:hypothetical protein
MKMNTKTKTRSFAAGIIGALVLGIVATTADAAPALGVTGAVRAQADDSRPIAKVTWGWHRGCYWHHGYRYCSWGHRHWHHYRPYYRGWGWHSWRRHYGWHGYHRYYHRYW